MSSSAQPAARSAAIASAVTASSANASTDVADRIEDAQRLLRMSSFVMRLRS